MEVFVDKLKKISLKITKWYDMGGTYCDMNENYKLLIKKNKDLLSFNDIDLNKIRFVFNQFFLYNIDANIIKELIKKQKVYCDIH